MPICYVQHQAVKRDPQMSGLDVGESGVKMQRPGGFGGPPGLCAW